jgi:hypothetical protein
MLEVNQAAYFRAACKSLDRSDLCGRLKLPPPGHWPPVAEARPEPFDTRDDPPPLDPVAHEVVDIHRRNEGLAVFRVGHASAGVATLVGMAIGVPVACAAATVSTWAAVGAFVVTLVVVRAFGRRRFDRCSEPECDVVIPADASLCPGCSGTISGRIARAGDRLAAREELEEQAESEQEADALPGAPPAT